MNLPASGAEGHRSKRSRQRYDDRHRTQMLVLVAVVGALGTTLAGNLTWSSHFSDIGPTPTLQTGWQAWSAVILGIVTAWILVPLLFMSIPTVSARWLAPVGLIETVWALASARSIAEPGQMWYSHTEAGSGSGALLFVGIVAGLLALAIPPAEPLFPATDTSP
jgi:hypothetical protein